MSDSIMQALFDGQIIPWERRSNHSPERKELEEKIESEKQYFLEKMSAEDGKRFEELERLYHQATFDEEVNTYSHGFTLGTLLMMEVLQKKEEVING